MLLPSFSLATDHATHDDNFANAKSRLQGLRMILKKVKGRLKGDLCVPGIYLLHLLSFRFLALVSVFPLFLRKRIDLYLDVFLKRNSVNAKRSNEIYYVANFTM